MEPELNAHNKEEYPPMHTAEHILNATMVRMFGCPRSRNAHIERKKSKCDYELPACPTEEQVAAIESAVNEVIGRNLDVTVEFMPHSEAAGLVDLSKLPEDVSETLRVVRVGDYDACACIGAHVRNTSEIGEFKILSHDYKDGRWRVRWKVVEKEIKFSVDTLRQEYALRLDGAMGTQIQQFNLTEEDFRQGLPIAPTRDVKGDNECLNLTRPDVIRSIHRSYVEAGADIIETNSFGANALVQQDYGLSSIAPDMALAAARLAREVADAAPRKVWVAGNMGPGSKSLSLVSDFIRPEWRPCSFDEVADSYAAQARALIEGGVDLIIIETCFDALNAKAALYGVHKARPGFPVIVSVSVSGNGGRVLTGQSLEAFFTAVSHAPLAAFGFNCSMGVEGLIPLVRSLGSWCPVPVVCYPNAGMPNAKGEYDECPEMMAGHMAGLDGEVNLYGGCCGTSPEHIHKFPSLKARTVPSCGKGLILSGLEMWDMGDGPITVSTAANVGKSADFAGMMERGEYEDALYAVSDELSMNSAPVLDVNLDGLPDSPALMERFVRLIQSDPSISSSALLIDSTDWETLLQGLKNAQGKSLAGPLNPDAGDFAQKAATLRSLGAAILVKACDDHAQVIQTLTAAGIPSRDIVFEESIIRE